MSISRLPYDCRLSIVDCRLSISLNLASKRRLFCFTYHHIPVICSNPWMMLLLSGHWPIDISSIRKSFCRSDVCSVSEVDFLEIIKKPQIDAISESNVAAAWKSNRPDPFEPKKPTKSQQKKAAAAKGLETRNHIKYLARCNKL